MTSIDRVDNNRYRSEIHTTAVITEEVEQEWAYAVRRGDCVTVKRMARQYGAALIDRMCVNELTALCSSSWHRMIPMTQCLREAGAYVNSVPDTPTPLHCASFNGDTNIVQLLLSSGAHVDAVYRNGNTALHYACEYERHDVIRLLMQYDADYTIVNGEKQTALDLALQTRDIATINAIQNAIRYREVAIQPFLTQLSNAMVQTQIEKLFSNKYNNLQAKIKEQQDQLDELKDSNETLKEQVIVIQESFERRLDEVKANHSFSEIRAQEREDSLKAKNARLSEQLHELQIKHQKLEKRCSEFRDWNSSKINVSPNVQEYLAEDVAAESKKEAETKASDKEDCIKNINTKNKKRERTNTSGRTQRQRKQKSAKTASQPTSVKFKESYQRLIRNCRKHKLTIEKNTAKDGNCFYHAVSMQLRKQGRKYSPKHIRRAVALHMKNNPQIKTRDGEADFAARAGNWERYCNKMGRDRQWVDDIVVAATAHYLHADLKIITSSEQSTPENCVRLIPGSAHKGSKPLLLGHVHECHYESLVEIDEESEDTSPCEMASDRSSDIAETTSHKSDAESTRSANDDFADDAFQQMDEDITGEFDAEHQQDIFEAKANTDMPSFKFKSAKARRVISNSSSDDMKSGSCAHQNIQSGESVQKETCFGGDPGVEGCGESEVSGDADDHRSDSSVQLRSWVMLPRDSENDSFIDSGNCGSDTLSA